MHAHPLSSRILGIMGGNYGEFREFREEFRRIPGTPYLIMDADTRPGGRGGGPDDAP